MLSPTRGSAADGAETASDRLVVTSERAGADLFLEFAAGDAPIAVFRRGARLFVAIARPYVAVDVDRSRFALDADGLLRSVRTRLLGDAALIQFLEGAPLGWRFTPSPEGFTVRLRAVAADALDPPGPPPPASLSFPEDVAGLTIEDVEVGDRLFVALAPPRDGFSWGAARKADLEVLDALHGAAIAPLADGVDVIRRDGALHVGRAVVDADPADGADPTPPWRDADPVLMALRRASIASERPSASSEANDAGDDQMARASDPAEREDAESEDGGEPIGPAPAEEDPIAFGPLEELAAAAARQEDEMAEDAPADADPTAEDAPQIDLTEAAPVDAEPAQTAPGDADAAGDASAPTDEANLDAASAETTPSARDEDPGASVTAPAPANAPSVENLAPPTHSIVALALEPSPEAEPAPPATRRLLDLARTNLRIGRIAEARELARDVGERDDGGQDREPDPAFVEAAALWAVASLLGRDVAAVSVFDDYASLGVDPEAALWRAYAASLEERWEDAADVFAASASLIPRHPPRLKRDLAFRATLAFERAGRLAEARAAMEALRAFGVAERDRPALGMLEARLLRAEGAPSAARDALMSIAPPRDRFAAAPLRFEKTRWDLEIGRINAASAARAWRRQSLYWPGHEDEAAFFHALASVEAQLGDGRRALEIWRRTLLRLPDAAEAEEIRNGMRATYVAAIERAGQSAEAADAALAIIDEYGDAEPEREAMVPALEALARTLAADGRHEDALDVASRLAEAASRDDDIARIGAFVAAIELAAGRPDVALEALRRSDDEAAAAAGETLRARRARLAAAAYLALDQVARALAAARLDRATAEDAADLSSLERALASGGGDDAIRREALWRAGRRAPFLAAADEEDAIERWRAALVDPALRPPPARDGSLDPDAFAFPQIDAQFGARALAPNALLEESAALADYVEDALELLDRDMRAEP